MKRAIAFLALLLVFPCVYASSNDIASFSPPEMAAAHWLKIGESQTEAFWYAYSIQRIGCIGSGNVDNRCATVNIALKDATKGLGDGYSALSILRGVVICNSYALPQDLFDGTLSTINVHSIPMREMTSGYIGNKTTLLRGTALARAVIRACKAVNLSLTKTGLPATSPMSSLHPSAPTALAGECSIPSPSYPMQAMRMGQQGVVKVGFTVSAQGRPIDISVESKFGVPALDAAAIAAVSRGTCNVAKGTRMERAVTFSLQQSS
jgi:TonB family protein